MDVQYSLLERRKKLAAGSLTLSLDIDLVFWCLSRAQPSTAQNKRSASLSARATVELQPRRRRRHEPTQDIDLPPLHGNMPRPSEQTDCTYMGRRNLANGRVAGLPGKREPWGGSPACVTGEAGDFPFPLFPPSCWVAARHGCLTSARWACPSCCHAAAQPADTNK